MVLCGKHSLGQTPALKSCQFDILQREAIKRRGGGKLARVRGGDSTMSTLQKASWKRCVWRWDLKQENKSVLQMFGRRVFQA